MTVRAVVVSLVPAALMAGCALTAAAGQPPTPPSVKMVVANGENDGSMPPGSFSAAFSQHASDQGYAVSPTTLEPGDFDGGDDKAHVLVVETHGSPWAFQLGNDKTQSIPNLSALGQRGDSDAGGSLRYLWLVACKVMAHGPTCEEGCPGGGTTRDCEDYSTPACFQPGDANAVDRRQKALGAGVRMVCGGSTIVRGTSAEADAVWWHLNNGVPPADAFILGLLAQPGAYDVPLCLARGPQEPCASPLYDATFIDEPNKATQHWYHLEYPVWLDPGDEPPPIDSVTPVMSELSAKPGSYAAPSSAGVGTCGWNTIQAPAPRSPNMAPGLLDRLAVNARAVVKGVQGLSKHPRMLQMNVDSYCQDSHCGGVTGVASLWPMQPHAKVVYAVFPRVVLAHLGATADPGKNVVELAIPELGASGRVVLAMDPRTGDVIRVLQKLRPVTGPWAPGVDERVLGVSEARERALAELRSTLGPGESVRTGTATSVNARLGKVAAPDVPQARLETWGFKDVGGELRAFYVFEYIVSTKSGAERVERIEVPAVLHTASGGEGTRPSRHLHHHSSDDDGQPPPDELPE